MRFNVRRIIRGGNLVRHAVGGIARKLTDRGTGQEAPPAQPAAPTPKPTKPSSPKKTGVAQVRKKQTVFKSRMKRQVTANPPKSPQGKPLNKQQRAQGANDALNRWKQKRKVT